MAVLKLTLLPVLMLMLTALASAADITVAADGSGDVKTVQAAVDRVPENNARRFVIAIKRGRYTEQVRIPANKPYISFVGEAAEQTVISYSISNKEAGSTSAAFAAYIGGHDFYAENVTFENSFGTGSQAVAVLVEADRAVFRKCRFLGWQDTLYAKNGRQYYKDCYIEGHVDYIFGQAAAVFETSEIHSKGDGYVTAPMRFSADEPAGFVFIKCLLTSNNTKEGIYLGRPWRDYGRTVFIETRMDAQVRPEGWHHWLPEREKTAFMAEYRSSGTGAGDKDRVKWARQLTEAEANAFSTASFLKGRDGWDPLTAKDDWLIKTRPDWKLVTWSEVFKQRPLWYQTDEAARIADQVIIYQKDNGGFEKNIDMALMLNAKERADIAARRSDTSETTIDNRTTYTQAAYLGRVITASLLKSSPPANLSKYKDAFNKAVDYLLSSQYENGGFPQFFPLKKGYYTHITLNDDAMIGVLELLRDIAQKEDDYLFVDEARRSRCEKAVARALPLILKLQVAIDGKRTVWAAQYDEFTLKPAAARKFEPVSLTSAESVGVVRFLMDVQDPTPEIKDAIESAVRWFRANRIEGFSWERKNGSNSLTPDKNAAPIWARFYQIETMRPIFIGRDAVIHYNVMEIEAERRDGYAWYVTSPGDLLQKDYPKWKARQIHE